MTDKTTSEEIPEAESGAPREWRSSDERLSPEEILRITHHLIRRIAERLQTTQGEKELHALTTDLMKLLALQRELETEEVREVTVRWIENDPEPPANA